MDGSEILKISIASVHARDDHRPASGPLEFYLNYFLEKFFGSPGQRPTRWLDTSVDARASNNFLNFIGIALFPDTDKHVAVFNFYRVGFDVVAFAV